MSTKHADRATNLRKLVKLLDDASNTIIDEWEKDSDAEPAAADGGITLPSSTLYSAQRVVQAVTGAVIEMVAEPQSRLLEVSSQYFESRALHIAAEHRIADFLHGSGEQGVHVDEISKVVGIEPLKLGEIACFCGSCFAQDHQFICSCSSVEKGSGVIVLILLQPVSFVAWHLFTFSAKVVRIASPTMIYPTHW
jgi:hypothetical protein